MAAIANSLGVLVALGLALIATWQIGFAIHQATEAYFVAFLVYLGAGWLIVRGPPRPSRWWLAAIFAVAIGCRLPAALTDPQLSDDIYRYVWDGRVQASGINPYLYAPNASELAALRDPLWTYINQPDQRTPYPPLSEALFLLVYRLAPESVRALQLTAAGLDLAVGAALAWLLTRLQLPPTRVLIWLWSPTTVLHFGHSGHNDPLMLLPLLVGLAWAAGSSRCDESARVFASLRGRLGWWPPRGGGWWLASAAAVAVAVLAKLLPLLLVPIWLRWWRLAGLVVFGVVLVAGYLPYLGAGLALLGGVATEGGESIFNDGLFWVLRQFMKPFGFDPVTGAKLLVVALLVGLATWLALRPSRGAPGAVLLDGSYKLLGTYVATAAVVEPWYAAWLLPFIAVRLAPGRWLGFAAGPTLGWLLFSGLVEVSDFTYGAPDVPFLWTWVRLIEWAPLAVLAIWPLVHRWRLVGHATAAPAVGTEPERG